MRGQRGRALALVSLLIAACSEAPASPAPPSPATSAAFAASGASAASSASGASAASSASAASIASAAPAASISASARAEPPHVSGVGACSDSAEIAIFTSPSAPIPGKPLRVVAVSSKPIDASLAVYGPGGEEAGRSSDRRGGPPSWWLVEIAAPAEGTYKAALGDAARIDACKAVAVSADPAAQTRERGPLWPMLSAWGEATENLYSAWIERLFDAPLDQQPSWAALHEVLRDPARNMLHDHLGQDEDKGGPEGITIDPDCADLPYFLRAYFAFKLGLPFAYSSCTRGHGDMPPKCVRFHSSLEASSKSRRGPAAKFGEFLRITLADVVHSGNGRIPASDDNSDYYSVAISTESLRPGTVYADPYGHMLVVAKRLPQTEASGGVLLAIDGQPDGTVARRRYWRGNFLFALDEALGSPGFKRFRPVVFEGRRIRRLSNDEILAQPGYGDFSLNQYASGVDGFYDAMDEVLSPAPQSTERVFLETIQALEEQVRGRVLSVQNGQDYLQKGGDLIEMPEGSAIFETTGPWEDFSTPSRDLRLLIAIDIVRGFPERAARRPDRYAMAQEKPASDAGGAKDKDSKQSKNSIDGSAMRERLGEMLKRELESRKVTYKRSDGSPLTLSLADVLARAEGLEMAYNPNDCVEARWAAPAGSDEAATCKRRAPSDQRAQMKRYRLWFHERRRPPRT